MSGPLPPEQLRQQVDRLLLDRHVKEKLSTDALSVVWYGHSEAWRFCHTAFNTAHLLIGMAKNSGTDAERLLTSHGASVRGLRIQLERLKRSELDVPLTPRPLTGELDLVFQSAATEADAVEITPMKLLHSLAVVPDCLALRLLHSLGIDIASSQD